MIAALILQLPKTNGGEGRTNILTLWKHGVYELFSILVYELIYVLIFLSMSRKRIFYLSNLQFLRRIRYINFKNKINIIY